MCAMNQRVETGWAITQRCVAIKHLDRKHTQRLAEMVALLSNKNIWNIRIVQSDLYTLSMAISALTQWHLAPRQTKMDGS